MTRDQLVDPLLECANRQIDRLLVHQLTFDPGLADVAGRKFAFEPLPKQGLEFLHDIRQPWNDRDAKIDEPTAALVKLLRDLQDLEFELAGSKPLQFRRTAWGGNMRSQELQGFGLVVKPASGPRGIAGKQIPADGRSADACESAQLRFVDSVGICFFGLHGSVSSK